MIALIDYRMGNLASVQNAFAKLNETVVIESNPDALVKYDKIILPGVGAFGDAMTHLKERGMDEAIKAFAQSGKWMLGICLGMQLLFDKSEEFGSTQGLGLIEGEVVGFDTRRFSTPLKVPHMGWNKLFAKPNEPLFSGMSESFYLYFVHSFHAVTDEKYVIGTTHYGYDFVSAVRRENIMGFQPHPEKSHENGLKIVQNFINLE
ncbi:MAG: glutamine amidotransferase [Sulfurovum sp. PC08-66]|nr:MAG: glutamine amidotransferase [Sulfurovum sp. PC08-66]KIM12416.1 MAG: glutamine amidotransferase [Sulfuricurvum sp. PC08-66]